jgi:hypothetical protein
MSEVKSRRPRVQKVEAMPVEAKPVQTPAPSPVAEQAPVVEAPKQKRVLTPEAREKLLANLERAREAKRAKAAERQKTSSL